VLVLADAARGASQRFGDAPAFVASDGWALSYADLDRASDEAAAGLAQRGVSEGDVVAIALPAIPEYAVAYVAASKLGAVTAGLNPRSTQPERAAALEVAAPRLLVATSKLAEGMPPALEVQEVTPAAGAPAMLGGLRVPGGQVPQLGSDPARLATIVFTSGTTGRAKGAVFTERQLAAIVEADTGGAWGAGGRMLSPTPLPHVGFMTKLPWYLRAGLTTFLLARWRAEDAMRLVAEQRLTTFGGVPTQMALVMRLPDFESYDISSVASITLGAGPATAALVAEIQAKFKVPVSVRYSSTESGGIGTSADGDDALDADGLCVGRPRGAVRVAVVDESLRPVPVGELGEVCLASPAVMSGYYRDPEQTAAAFTPDGSVRSGDMGWLDDRGRLHLAGRHRERYVRGGYNVYPAEVEAALAEHPAVAQVAIVPAVDHTFGQIGVAAVVPLDAARPPSLEDLRTFAGARVASYKLPDRLMVVDALPLTAMEKLDRAALERVVEAQS
jgi:acyl-CoA synthetase (AMP-forming)/AMP-acid ligase II